MNAAHLKTLFSPKTIAVIGASRSAGSVGYSLLKNLIDGGYKGIVYPVNPKYDSINGVKTYPDISSIGEKVDMAIIAVPASKVPMVLEACAKAGVPSSTIVTAGFKEAGAEGVQLTAKIQEIIHTYGLTVLGPNCLGFIRPPVDLNASFLRKNAKAGGIAFISQSGALGSAVLDWAVKENVGFSAFVSIGDMVDIGYHDLIDYFGNDPATSSILIYMESLTEARKFMSAARGFARTKPIIILKVGKSLEGARAARSHTGSLTGNDQVFDAAFKRVGVLRVKSIRELFDCAKTLAMQKRPGNNRLAIVTNAGGPGVIATDRLIDLGGKLADLQDQSVQYLNEKLPAVWSHENPVDVLGDADVLRYRHGVSVCLNDPFVDGVLVILTPQAVTDAAGVAREIVDVAKTNSKTILAAWMGDGDVEDGRRILEDGNIPAYERPEEAVKAFMNMYAYGSNLQLLNETPATTPHAFSPKTEMNRKIITDALKNGRYVLTEPEAKKFLTNYEIPVPRGYLAVNADDAVAKADSLGYPVVMKIVSADIVHKIDVGGVLTNLANSIAVRHAFESIIHSVSSHLPRAKIDGVYVEEMIQKKYELIIGSNKDPIFGPVIIFGMGGVAVEVFKDTNFGLPPLNMALAQRLIEGTKIYQLLKGFRGSSAVDISAIQFLLYKFAYMVCDFPQIKELDINPFVVDETGGIVLDAKVILDEKNNNPDGLRYSHLVISPYPSEYEKHVTTNTGQTVFLRPIRPEDEIMEAEMFTTFSSETQRFRFFGPIKDITHEMLIRYTQIDYDREIAIIAELSEGGKKRMLGVVRVISDAYNEMAEFAIVIGDPWQKQGLGGKMMEHMLDICRKRHVKKLYAYTLPDNSGMLHLFKKFGFTIKHDEDLYRVDLKLGD